MFLSKYWISLLLILVTKTLIINGISCYTCDTTADDGKGCEKPTLQTCGEADVGCMAEGGISSSDGDISLYYTMMCAESSYCKDESLLCPPYDEDSGFLSCRGCCLTDACNADRFREDYVKQLVGKFRTARGENLIDANGEPFKYSNVDAVSEEPATEPQTEEPATEPQTEEPATEPQTEEPVTEPQTEEPVTEPQTEEPVTEPQTEEPTTEPQTEEPTTEPQTEEPITEPPTEVPVTEPSTTTSTTTRRPSSSRPPQMAEKKSDNSIPSADPIVAHEAQPSSQTQLDNVSFKLLPNSIIYILISCIPVFLR